MPTPIPIAFLIDTTPKERAEGLVDSLREDLSLAKACIPMISPAVKKGEYLTIDRVPHEDIASYVANFSPGDQRKVYDEILGYLKQETVYGTPANELLQIAPYNKDIRPTLKGSQRCPD